MTSIARTTMRYALVTAAYNEERYIETLINSVIAQRVRPLRWVIVSDGSTDRTDQIVLKYAAQHEFIELLRIEEDHPRNFAAQVIAINKGLVWLASIDYGFIGNLDADVSFGPSYFSDLIDVFAADPSLGLAGGSIFERQGGLFRPRPTNRESSVAHAVQFFRRECFEALGGAYIPLPYGGPDWYAAVRSRMNGWRVRSLEKLEVYHHRPPGGGTGWIRASFRQGQMDHSLGTHPLFEALRIMRRLRSTPFIMYACARLAGFLFSNFTFEERAVSPEFVRFLRKEEVERLWRVFPRSATTTASIDILKSSMFPRCPVEEPNRSDNPIRFVEHGKR
jgi:glycosyltransferase involved in cell wall biosynthesis